MAELLNNFDFPEARQGTTYDRVTFDFAAEEINNLSGASIFMVAKKSSDTLPAAEFSTENDKLSILSDYSFCFQQQIINLPPETYHYDILVIFQDGRRDMPLGGKFTVAPANTRKK